MRNIEKSAGCGFLLSMLVLSVCAVADDRLQKEEKEYRRVLEVVKHDNVQSALAALRTFVKEYPGSMYADDSAALVLSTATGGEADPAKWESFVRKYPGQKINDLTINSLGKCFYEELSMGYDCRLLWEYWRYFLSRADAKNLAGDVYGRCAFVFASDLADRIKVDEKTRDHAIAVLSVMRAFYKSQGDVGKVLEIEKRIERTKELLGPVPGE